MKLKILVVDDEVEIANLVKNYLTLCDYDVEAFYNPVEALERIKTSKFHIVITDIVMPDMSGVDLIREIKKHDGMIQVIAITGYVTIDNILTAFRLGAQNMFFKPFDNMDEIIAEIKLIESKFERIAKVLKSRSSAKNIDL